MHKHSGKDHHFGDRLDTRTGQEPHSPCNTRIGRSAREQNVVARDAKVAGHAREAGLLVDDYYGSLDDAYSDDEKQRWD